MGKGFREALFRDLSFGNRFFFPDVKDQKAPGPPEKIPVPPFKEQEFVSARPWMYFIGGPCDGDRVCIPYPIDGQSWLWALQTPLRMPLPGEVPSPVKTHKYIFHTVRLRPASNPYWFALHESLSLEDSKILSSIYDYLSPLPPSADDE